MKLRKWVKIALVVILMLISTGIYLTTGNNSNSLELLKWLWLFAQLPVYKMILS